jgi:integrase
MDTLKTKLLEKYSEGTANLYLTKLRLLNRDKPFTSLAFLKDHVKMNEAIDKIENVNTRKSYLTALVGVLEQLNNPTYNKVNSHYKTALNNFKVDVVNKIDPNEKTQAQADNWMNWSEVMNMQEKLKKAADVVTAEEVANNNSKAIDAIERNVLLSLYTSLPPRRNADYFQMVIGTGDDKDKNYYDGEHFIFNVYKTVRSRGAEKLAVPNVLRDTLDDYIKLMALKNGDWLLFPETKDRNGSVKMTRSLNSIFGKNVSSSMLRHIWNTHLLGPILEKVKENAAALGHSIGTDLNYVKM